MLLLRLIAFGLLIFFLHKIFNPKSVSVPQQSDTHEPSAIEIKMRQSENEFVSTFGFDPRLIREYKHRKELLLKLGLLAKEIGKTAENALRSPSMYRDRYAKVSREYIKHLKLIAVYDPEFEKEIPHWTELSEFARGWRDGERYKGKQQNIPQK